MPRMKGKYALVEMLRAEGVKYIFGNPGTTESPLTDALEPYPDVQYLTALQEATAIGMADGYARATGRPAFVNVHISVGLSNALSMLYCAHRGGTPLVVTAGQVDARLLNHEATLSSDQKELARLYTKWSAELTHAGEIPAIVRRAFRQAMTPPTGPVFLSLPWNVMDEEAEVEIAGSSPVYPRQRPDTRAVEEATALLSRAQKPVMLIGDRIAQSGAVDEAVALAETLGAPVYALSFSEVNFPTSHPLYQGALNTSWATPRVRAVFEGSDAVLAVGATVVRQLALAPGELVPPGTRIVHVDNSPWEIEKSYPVAVGVLADIGESMKELATALSEAIPPAAKQAAMSRMDAMRKAKAERKAAFQGRAKDALARTPMGVEGLMGTLAQVLPPDAIVTTEAPTSSGAMMQAISFDRPGSFYSSRGGGLGWGMPGPVGVKLASPGRPVVGLVGDGAAMYTIQALWTAARYRIPVVYVVCNNRTYKILKEGMARYLAPEGRESKHIGMDFYERPLDLAKIAEGFGVPGYRVERAEQLRPALEKALGGNTTAVVDVSIAEDQAGYKALAEDWRAWYRK